MHVVASSLGFITLFSTMQISHSQEPSGIGINYGLVFEMYADQVEIHRESDNRVTRTLSLPGEIIVRQTETESYRTTTGWDHSGAGAVGCILRLFLEARRALDICTNAWISPGSEAQIDTTLDRIGQFYGENAIPSFTRGHFSESLTDYRERNLSNRMECPNTDIITMVDMVLADDFGNFIENLLAVPRLPVGNPCL